MSKRPNGQPIASRQLLREGTDRPVHVFIWQPFEEESEVWACPYQIRGFGKDTIRYARGSDAVQALQLSFEAVRADLNPESNRIYWIESEIPDAGFPRTIPWTLGKEAYEHLCGMVDREVHKAARSAQQKHQRSKTASKPKKTKPKSRSHP